jgi:type I restriction enzyme M protein
MAQAEGFADKVGFIWSVADLLRGDYKAHEYGQVILPLTVLRRLDCVLEPTKDTVVARARELAGKMGNIDPLLLRAARQPFYNTSPLTFPRLLDDAPNIAANLRTYIAGYSPAAAEVLDKYGLDNQITRLDTAGLLYHVVARFADIDLHPNTVSNTAMGYVFEELLRKFSEMSNETAGEHFTPREVIRLMVNILFSEDDDALRGTAPVRTMYDCACGTGGMLTAGQEHLADLNPRARLEVFGQELNPETWAIARSDLMIKGQDPARIVLGNSFTADGFAGQHFDYMLANPPFGVDWKRIERQIKDEADHLGHRGRFGAGLPRINDGSFLFLQTMISKMKPVAEGGSRLAIVFSGSPLFSGTAWSGESEIRRWIIENDWLEGIVALPDQLFYNTGISTYFWVVTNRKTDDRKGKVVLLDAREQWTKMRKSLGEKRKEITGEQIAEVTRLYHDAIDLDDHDDRIKVFANSALGYKRITVERPMRRRWYIDDETFTAITASKPFAALTNPPKDATDPVAALHLGEQTQRDLIEALGTLREAREDHEAAFNAFLGHALGQAGLTIPTPLRKTILTTAAHPDPDAPVVTDRKGQPLPDPDLRDNENVPLGDDIHAHMEREVLPHVPVEVPGERDFVPDPGLGLVHPGAPAPCRDRRRDRRGRSRDPTGSPRSREVTVLKHVADVRVSNVDKKSYAAELPVRLCNYTDVYYGEALSAAHKQYMEATASAVQCRKFLLVAGDTVLTKDSETADDIGVSAFIAESAADFVCGYHLAILRPDRDLIEPKYLFWLTRSTPVRDQMSIAATGVTRFGLRTESLASVSFALPTLHEQRRIADFLDDQIGFLDRAIELRQRHVLLAREAWIATMDAEVRGLDGIATRLAGGWLGQINEKWAVSTIGRLAITYAGAGFPPEFQGEDSGDLPFLKVADLAAQNPKGEVVAAKNYVSGSTALRLGARVVPPGTILFPKVGAALLTNSRALLSTRAVMDNNVMGVQPRGGDPRYWRYLMLRIDLGELANPGPVPSINDGQVRALRVPVPSLEEQRRIADTLDHRAEAVAETNYALTRSSVLLIERKHALITAAVTGEFDVTTARSVA